MKKRLVLYACLMLLPACATTYSSSGRDLAGGIRKHSFITKRALILGDGVSPEAASRVSGQSGAMVLYCPSRSADVDFVKAKASSGISGPSTFTNDVMATLRAMAFSGDTWEIAVAERARGQMRIVLSAMRSKELLPFSGKLILSNASRSDRLLQDQIRRVFGERITIEYIGSEAP